MALKELMDKVADDEALIGELTRITTADELVAFARRQGFDVSEDEARAALTAEQDGELSEADLDAVAGGGCTGFTGGGDGGPFMGRRG